MTNWEITMYVVDVDKLGRRPDVTQIWTDNIGKEKITMFDKLNTLSAKGWELVSVTPIIDDGKTRQLLYTFKRPIQSPESKNLE